MVSLRLSLLVLLGAVSVAGCIDTVPTPEDDAKTPGPTIPEGDIPPDAGALPLGQIFYARDEISSALVVAGTAGAVPPDAVVRVENLGTLAAAQRRAAADGSFTLLVDAEAGDQLRVLYWVGTVLTGASQLTVQPASAADIHLAGYAGTGGVDAAFSVSACGESEVCLDAVAGTAPAGATVVVANPAAGATSTPAAFDGSFTAKLAATSGDGLLVFAVPAGAQSGGPPVLVVVP